MNPEPGAAHGHDTPTGRTVENLGLCPVTEACRKGGHLLARTTLQRSSQDRTVEREICVTCSEASGRLEGLRLWHSVCPCCFSSAFPDGLPTLESSPAQAGHP